MTTGLLQSSMRASSGCMSHAASRSPHAARSRLLISAPATNVLPAPMNTIADTASSRSAASKAWTMASGTPGLSALTGGLSTAMTATVSLMVVVTGLDMTVRIGLLGHSSDLISIY